MTGVELIAAERERQVTGVELRVSPPVIWTPEHDDNHRDGSLAWAAVCYAAPGRVYRQHDYAAGPSFRDPWPWENAADARKDGGNRPGTTYPNVIPTEGPARVRMLVKAGALIAAEIDRLGRIA